MKACKNCHLLNEDSASVCAACGGSDLSERYNSTINVFNPEKSEIAKKLGAKVKGAYAVRIK